ncbi:MAG: hypothetical protein ACOC0P_00705 [Planctomycetota bacterium]
MNDMTVTVGSITIEIMGVAHHRTDREEGGDWIVGQCTLQVRGERGEDMGMSTFRVGCWADTDDDEAVWNSDHEGARAIAAAFGSKPEDADQFALVAAFGSQCGRLGDEICEMLREAAADAAAAD